MEKDDSTLNEGHINLSTQEYVYHLMTHLFKNSFEFCYNPVGLNIKLMIINHLENSYLQHEFNYENSCFCLKNYTNIGEFEYLLGFIDNDYPKLMDGSIFDHCTKIEIHIEQNSQFENKCLIFKFMKDNSPDYMDYEFIEKKSKSNEECSYKKRIYLSNKGL